MLLQDLSFFLLSKYTQYRFLSFDYAVVVLHIYEYKLFPTVDQEFQEELICNNYHKCLLRWLNTWHLDCSTPSLQNFIKNISSFLTPTIHLLWPDIKDSEFFSSKYIMSNFSYLCWWQLLQVCVQPEGRVYERCVCAVPGNDRRQILNHCHNLSQRHEHAIIESMFSLFFSPTSVQVAH